MRSRLKAFGLLILMVCATSATSSPLDDDDSHARILDIYLPGEWSKFRSSDYSQAAAALQSLGKEAACKELLTSARRDERKRGSTAEKPYIILCRMLFVPRRGLEFRRPGLGGPGFVGTTKMGDWPLEPIEIVDGVPFLITHGYSLFGKAETPEQYLDYCTTECDWSTYRFKVRDRDEALAAFNKLIASPKFKEGLHQGDTEFLRAQIR